MALIINTFWEWLSDIVSVFDRFVFNFYGYAVTLLDLVVTLLLFGFFIVFIVSRLRG